MENTNSKQAYEIGMVGLGVMGRNLLLIMADHGLSVVGYDNDPTKVNALRQEAGKGDIHCKDNLREFISILRKPRAILLLVPTGAPVDAVSNSWLPANLIQAQCDYFGAHTDERIDAKGTFHAEWLK
jgi:6-phosphogluconate dehydrogenase